MEKAGGDPVLMASANQWPVVDLEDADDMVRAHCCAFEAFEADAALHLLSIPDAGAHAPPAHPSAATPGGFPALPAGVAVRWAVGVFNFDLVKRGRARSRSRHTSARSMVARRRRPRARRAARSPRRLDAHAAARSLASAARSRRRQLEAARAVAAEADDADADCAGGRCAVSSTSSRPERRTAAAGGLAEESHRRRPREQQQGA